MKPTLTFRKITKEVMAVGIANMTLIQPVCENVMSVIKGEQRKIVFEGTVVVGVGFSGSICISF